MLFLVNTTNVNRVLGMILDDDSKLSDGEDSGNDKIYAPHVSNVEYEESAHDDSTETDVESEVPETARKRVSQFYTRM